MKTQILLTILLAFGLVAKAGNEGAQAEPGAPATVLAEYKMNGGLFVPPGAVSAKSYQVLSNGRAIKVWFVNGSTQSQTKILKVLAPAKLAQFKALVDSVKPGQMRDPNPSSPGCEDAPGYSYKVNNAAGAITIGQTYACKTFVRDAAVPADAKIMKALSDLAKANP